MKRIGVWFTNNLRVDDNIVLQEALKTKGDILPFYIFDKEEVYKTSYGFRKIGKYRAQFLCESLKNLRENLHKKESDLKIIQVQETNQIEKYILELKLDTIYIQDPVGIDEVKYLIHLQTSLKKNSIKLIFIWDHTLLDPENLPFSVRDLPKIFSNFRKQVEKDFQIEAPFIPGTLGKTLSQDSWGDIPNLSDFGYEDYEKDIRQAYDFVGGEDEAKKRLQYYLWESNNLSKYKETRNELIGGDYSSKFSPWLALGCISARSIYAEIKKYEKNRIKNDSTYWLVFELLWRDFFQFAVLQDPMVFFQDFPEERYIFKNHQEKEIFEKWRNGTLGVAFIDANMKELKHTGFMSNRGRQNVASYLKNDLKLDWRLGAIYFEEMLIDYDIASNWGNWAYVAGVGNDPRDNRYFNTERQQSMYDSDGAYRKLWK